MTPEERSAVIRDIARWKVEYERMGRDITDEELAAFIESREARSDTELRTDWYQTVGEWVLSRDDMASEYADIGADEWLEAEFDALCAGEPTTYGFVVDVWL